MRLRIDVTVPHDFLPRTAYETIHVSFQLSYCVSQTMLEGHLGYGGFGDGTFRADAASLGSGRSETSVLDLTPVRPVIRSGQLQSTSLPMFESLKLIVFSYGH